MHRIRKTSDRARCALRSWLPPGYLLIGALLGGASAGCGDAWRHQTASLGGSTAGSRGSIRVLIINNTDWRPAFTLGTYDPADRLTEADFEQFGVKDRERTLDGSETSDFISVRCGRIFAVGSPGLIEAVPDADDPTSISQEALSEGVTFYDVSGDEADPVVVGTAPPLEALLGVDFPCGALLVIYLEPADVGTEGFRIDFGVIPAESTR